MNYTICHHGTYWFQIRVPEELVPCYGRLIRQNLRTREPTEAKPLALKLASEWLQRFAAEKSTPKSTTDPCTLMQPAREAPDFMQMAYPVQSMRIMGWSKVQPVHMHHVSQSSPAQIADGKRPAPATPPRRRVETPAFDDTIDGLVSYWRRLHPECVPSTYREVQRRARVPKVRPQDAAVGIATHGHRRVSRRPDPQAAKACHDLEESRLHQHPLAVRV